MNFLIGCDPELFVRDNTDAEYVSAHTFLPGTKEKPHRVIDGAVQLDGVAAEFNIKPARSKHEFVHNINSVLGQMTVMAKQYNPEYELIAQPTAWFDETYFKELPEDVKLLGCQPDYNAYTGIANPPPGTNKPFRTGSFHIHIGWDDYLDVYSPEHISLCCNLVKQLDQALYYPSLSWDKDTQRRELYGKMGAFRPKSYGLEYRPLSNKVLSDFALVEFVYDRTVWACDLFFNKGIKLYENAPDLPKAYR